MAEPPSIEIDTIDPEVAAKSIFGVAVLVTPSPIKPESVEESQYGAVRDGISVERVTACETTAPIFPSWSVD